MFKEIKFLALNIIMLTFLLTSCENPLVTDDEDSLEGNLMLSVSQLEQTPLAESTRTPVADACTRLNYAVYSMDGARIKQINQSSAAPGFGSAAFQLEEGTYQLVVVAHSSNGNPTMTNPAKIQFTNAQGFTDTFFCREEVTVGSEPIALNLTLSRNVSLCRFVVTDEYPAGAAKIKFYYTGGSGAFDAKTGLGCVNSRQEHTFDLTSGQKQFDLYTFLHSTSGNLRLRVTVYDSHDNVLLERIYKDIPMQQKYITYCSDALFAGVTTTTGVSLILNTDWAPDTLITF